MSNYDMFSHRRSPGEALLRDHGFPGFDQRKIPWVLETARPFSTKKEFTEGIGIFDFNESAAPDSISGRTFIYRFGRGKDYLPHDINHQGEPRFFRFHELSLVSHHSPLIKVFQRRFMGGEYDFYIEVTTVPEGEPPENDFAEMTVRYYPGGRREILPQGLGEINERQILLEAGFPILSTLPKKISFAKTLRNFTDRATKLDFSDPLLL